MISSQGLRDPEFKRRKPKDSVDFWPVPACVYILHRNNGMSCGSLRAGVGSQPWGHLPVCTQAV